VIDAGYTGQAEDFLSYVGTLLGAVECPRERRVAVYRQAERMANSPDWAAVRGTGLDRLFLRWCLPDPNTETGLPYFLTSQDAGVDHNLPASILEGIERDDAFEAKKRRDARKARIARCTGALREGWVWEDAVAFVASREEWKDAKDASFAPGRAYEVPA